MKVLVTGGTGFIGQALLRRMQADGLYRLRVAVRSPNASLPDEADMILVVGLSPQADWQAAVAGVDMIVHTAARVHVMRDQANDPLEEYRRVNVSGMLCLARQAAEAGVRRFVYISSIKVNGEQTPPGQPFRADDRAAPEDAYGISKMEAEQGLLALARETGLEVVIIRPPLVYGPGVKGNFAVMMRWVEKGVPLPLGAIRHNRRSLVALDNLVDLIMTCMEHPAAANEVFLAGDGNDLSTAELLRKLARAMDRPARLIPVPQGVLEAALKALGKGELAKRLCGSLQVDISKARDLLGWEPKVSVDEGLRCTVEPFLAEKSG